MRAFADRGINDIYPLLVYGLRQAPKVEQRGLTAREWHPVMLEFWHPRRRLVTSYGRPVNVAFALAEVLWILGGRADVAMLAPYNSRMADYSDDGTSFNAAYGKRLRYSHGYDQLLDVEATLANDPGSRQATAVEWHPDDMSLHTTKDRACNLLSHFMIRDGALDLMQVMRSNDIIWGLPYNIMQWTHVQEWMAARLQVPVGKYVHVADSLHLYDPPLDGSELPTVRFFDLYEAFNWQHEAMTGEDVDLKEALRIEEWLRVHYDSVKGIALADQLPRYWMALLQVLEAHHLYRAGRNREAYAALVRCSDKVYGAAQVRFYMHHRWHTSPQMVELVETDYDPQVAKWILQDVA